MSAPPPPRARPEVRLTTDIKPSHYDALARLHIAAFDPSWISKRINPPEKRLDMSMRVAANISNRTLAASHPPPSDQREVIALLPPSPSFPSGQPVGIAIWYAPISRLSTLGHPLPEELAYEAEAKAREKSEVVREVEKTQDLEWFARFREEMGSKRREWSKGGEHWYLKVLAVDPKYNGLGIGSQLLAWGTTQAERDGVPCWLEATDEGRLLYDRRGWKVISWCEMDDDEIEGGQLRWPGMALGEFRKK